MTAISFAQSPFLPIAVGFFGLGTGYFIWGGQAMFGFPKSTPEVNKSMGMWGVWMPGFLQFITGVYLMVGLTWFGVYTKSPPLYMAALAFTAYGVHWFAMGHRRFIGSDSTADGWMAIPFFLISLLGMLIFFKAGDVPVAILFIGLVLIYLTEIPARFSGSQALGRTVGFWQFITGIWLMYLMYGVVFNTALGGHWWV